MLGGEDNLHSIRARTAISRTDLSRPLKCAIADRLIGTDTSVFDYGCGRGDDLRHLIAMGYKASGWDPVHWPDNERSRAEIVNLGYVVNVIEDFNERCDVLGQAWELAKDLLIVSARLSVDHRGLRSSRTLAARGKSREKSHC